MTANEQKRITRRDFVKGLVVGGAIGAFGSMLTFSYSPLRKVFFVQEPKKNIDIGECKSIKILNISETSWFDNKMLTGDMKRVGGLLVNQYEYNWPPFAEKGGKDKIGKGSYEKGIKEIKQWLPNRLDKAWEFQLENAVNPENAGGYAALVDVELLDGSHKKILLDSGWSYAWMEESFKREGIDKMLANREIDFFISSHEHFDHFWGLPVTLKYYPDITIYAPDTFYPEGRQYITDAGHRGKVVWTKGITKLFPGAALYTFPVPIICRVFGEHSLFFNVKDKGLVLVTGCCHQGIIQFASAARKDIKFSKLYGIYGGLHISPFEDWDPKYDDLVIAFRDYGFDRMGCNHCTGIVTARKFVDAGYPVVKGTARFRSKDTAYLGNGDTIEF